MPISTIQSGSFPSNIAIDTDTLVVDGANNRVGIGVSDPSQAIDLVGSSNSGSGSVRAGGTGSGTQAAFIAQAQFGSASFGTYASYPAVLNSLNNPMVYFNTNASGRAVFAEGITFNGDTAAANALDDYEEVSFTATLGGSGGQPGTPITVTGFATKIGRVVQYSIGFENVNTTGYSGQINISGLPFANAGGRAMGNFVAYLGATWTGNDNFTEIGVGQTVLNVYTIGSASTWTGTTHNAGASGRYFWATGTYITS